MTPSLGKRIHQLSQENPTTLFIIPSGRAPARSHCVMYPFKPPSDFFYLTGLAVENSYLLIFEGHARLLIQKQTERQITWMEFENLQAQIKDDAEYNEVIEILESDFGSHSTLISHLMRKCEVVASVKGRSTELDLLLSDLLHYNRKNSHFFGKNRLPSFVEAQLLIGGLRAVKDDLEILKIDEAVRRTLQVHNEFSKVHFDGRSEKQVRDHFELEFLKKGLRWPSYQTIVGSGTRSCGLHSRPSEVLLEKNDLVLIDAGAEYESYCADITRTWAGSGDPCDQQAAIIELVTQVQKDILSSIFEKDSFTKIDQLAKELLAQGLGKLIGGVVSLEEVASLMPHGTSHWLGLDVHDPCPYYEQDGQSVCLKKGMVMTIEPGLYFRDGLDKKFNRYRGIGVRIEDDVVVDDNGLRLLGQ
jgi:Xaa-Pro aminopeptidase